MNIINKSTKDLKPYAGNAKKHSESQIDNVAASIDEFGFVQPVVIDKDGVIVIGHCRTLAAQKLGLEKIPCVCVDDLTPEQVKALRLIDNKTNESEWDLDILKDELDGLDMDFSEFGFDLDEIEDEIFEHEENAEHTQERVENILNLGKGQYEGNNPFDFPQLEPVYDLPPIKEWIGFNFVMSDKNPEGKAVHFFIDDYQFERIWANPEKYLDRLRQYVCVATPDFSPYGDMPLICQMWNHYRKHWIGAWLQERGVTVVPTIRASSDERSLEWYLDGEPKNGIVLISDMWTAGKEDREYFMREFNTMKETLNPNKIFVYGKKMELGENVEFIDSYTRGRFGD